MSGGRVEVNRDNDYISSGTHKGADAANVLSDPGADFKSCGINGAVGQYIANDTQSTGGNVTASTEDTVTDDTNSWDTDDIYYIYATDEYNSIISTIWTDKRYGHKTDKRKMTAGIRHADQDLDEWSTSKQFGPGFPEGR